MNACDLNINSPVVRDIAEKLGIYEEEALQRLRDYQAATGKEEIPNHQELMAVGATYAAMRIFEVLNNPKFQKNFNKALEFKQSVGSVLKSFGIPSFYVDELMPYINERKDEKEWKGEKFTIDDLKEIALQSGVIAVPFYFVKRKSEPVYHTYSIMGYSSMYGMLIKTNTLLDIENHPSYLEPGGYGIGWIRYERPYRDKSDIIVNYERYTSRETSIYGPSRYIQKNGIVIEEKFSILDKPVFDFVHNLSQAKVVADNDVFKEEITKILENIQEGLKEAKDIDDVSFSIEYEKMEEFQKHGDDNRLFKEFRQLYVRLRNGTGFVYNRDDNKIMIFKKFHSPGYELKYNEEFNSLINPRRNIATPFTFQHITPEVFRLDKSFNVLSDHGIRIHGNIITIKHITSKNKPTAEIYGDDLILANIQTDLKNIEQKNLEDPTYYDSSIARDIEIKNHPLFKYLMHGDKWVDILLQEALQHARITGAKRIIIPSGEVIRKKWKLNEDAQLKKFYDKTVLKKARRIFGKEQVMLRKDLVQSVDTELSYDALPDDEFYVFNIDHSKPLKPLYYHLYDNDQKYRDRINKILSEYADEDGFIFPQYYQDVAIEIDNIPDTYLRVTKDGKRYIESPFAPSKEGKEALTFLLDRLSEQFGIKYRFDTSINAKGYFDGDTVVINPNHATRETAIHEFAHPFIKLVKQENPSLYNRLVRTVKRTGVLDEIKEKYRDIYTNEEDFIEEAIVTAFSRRAVMDKASKTILEKFAEWISNLLKKLFGVSVKSSNSLDELYTMFNTYQLDGKSNTLLDKIENAKTTYYQIDKDKAQYYADKINQANDVQRETLRKLASIETQFTLAPDGSGYMGIGNVKLKRVTEWIDSFDFYKYEGISDEDALNIGSDVDAVAEAAILGKPMPNVQYISKEIAQQIYDEFTAFKEEQEKQGNIVIPQVTLGDIQKGIAGTADFIIVKPDGTIKIVDLKTSRHKFRASRRKYPNKEKADVFDKHDAQLTAYMALAKLNGLDISNDTDTLSVIGYTINRDDNNFGTSIEEVKKIVHTGDKFIYSKLNPESGKKEIHVLEELKLVLQKKLQQAKKAGNARQVAALESLIEHITLDIPIQAVNRFVEEAHTTFLGGKNFRGYYEYIDSLFLDIANGIVSIKDGLNDIHRISEYIDMYLPALINIRNELVKYNGNEPFSDVEPGSMLDKLDKTISTLQFMKKRITSEGSRLIARELANHVTPSAIEGIKKMLKEHKKKITRIEELYKKKKSTYLKNKLKKEKERLALLEEKFLNEKGEVDFARALQIEILKGGYQDTSFIDRYLYSAVNSPSLFMSAFSLALKKSFEKARVESLELLPKATKLYREYAKRKGQSIDRPDRVNEAVLEERIVYVRNNETGEHEQKKVLSLVSPIDYSAFNTARNKMFRELKDIDDPEIRALYIKKWNAENMQVRPEKHIEGVTKIGDVILIETIEDLEKRKKKELGKYGFERWKRKNMRNGNYTGEYLIPDIHKYRNEKFVNMSKEDKDYYIEVLKMYFDAQDNVPRRKEEDRFILPYISKSTNDRALENGLYRAAKHAVLDAFVPLSEDVVEENIKRERVIPVLYWNNGYVLGPDEVSRDVVQSVLRFSIAARRYNAKKEYHGLAMMLEEMISQTTPIETLNNSPLLDRAAKELGIDSIDRFAKKDSSNSADLLTAFIDKNIFEIHRKDPIIHIAGKSIDSGKVANAFMRIASFTGIAFKPLTAVANSLTAQLQVAEEAFAGQYIDTYTWRKAQAEYASFEGNMLKDLASPYRKSFIGQLFDLYEPLQGEVYDEFGRKVTQSNKKYFFDTSTGFIAMHKGEHRAAMVMLIAQLMKKKLSNGKSLYEHLKERYEKNGKLTKEDYDFDIANKVHAINKRLHGIYDRFNAPDIMRNFVGRLLLMYRKFLYPGIKRRFGNEYFDLESGNTEVGFMRVFYQKLFSDARAIIEAFRKKADTITETEMYAIRRALMEHFIVMGTGLLAYALIKMGWGDDDDDESRFETWYESFVLYEVLRINAEISIFGAPGDINDYFLPDPKEMLSTVKQVSAAASFLERMKKVFDYTVHDSVSTLFGGDIARYERKTGMFNKGDSKLVAAIMKLLGVNGYTYNPEEALKSLFMARGVDVKTTIEEEK